MNWFNLALGIVFFVFGILYGIYIYKELKTTKFKQSASSYHVNVWKGFLGSIFFIIAALMLIGKELKNLL